MMVEEIFSSKGRVKILRLLVEIGELNISEIARRAGLNYATTNQHLDILEKAGLVLHKSFGRIRIYRLNEDNAYAAAVKSLIEGWEHQGAK
ncbi:MAG TPA: winged helix-turn-helix domain-containing protein [Candidatus Krumholzibacteriaceae bacterium]|jgi:DNA-binding transcriptional ArsR family regulator|nr:winged helix-turn-helix domain-containing protein [Candidatus Krumholzibacteriaceae bacterium]